MGDEPATMTLSGMNELLGWPDCRLHSGGFGGFAPAWGKPAMLHRKKPGCRVYELRQPDGRCHSTWARGAKALLALKTRMGRAWRLLVHFNNGFNIFGSLIRAATPAAVFGLPGDRRVALPLFSSDSPAGHPAGGDPAKAIGQAVWPCRCRGQRRLRSAWP